MKSTNQDDNYLVKNFRLVKARELAGLSQSDVARRVGILHATYFTYERMKNEPQQNRKTKIAQILRQPVEYLFPEKIKQHYATRAKSEDIYDNCEKMSFDFEEIF